MNNTELLKFAESFLDKGGATFRKYCGLGSGDAWCDAFVTYVFHKGDDALLFCAGKKQTYCPTTIKWCYNNLAQIPPYLAMPSDIIFFDWELNGVPNHIGLVRQRKSADVVFTIEGNTSKTNKEGKVIATGVVAERTRNARYVQAIFRPHFEAKFTIKKPLVIDGQFGYTSIAMLQRVLGQKPTGILDIPTVKALQKCAGVAQDGSWGKQTSKAVQKMIGTTVDGYFGEKSVKALQTWINKQAESKAPDKEKYSGNFPSLKKVTTTTHNREKMYETANKLAYATNTSKAKYPSGKPTEAYKKALAALPMSKHRWCKAAKLGANCDVFVWVVACASGVDKNLPSGLWKQLSYMQKHYKEVGVSNAKEGDIGFYRKDVRGKHGHIFIIGKGNEIKEASHDQYYPKTTKSKTTRLSKKGKKYVYVFRVPEKTTTKYVGLEKGDSGDSVIYLQKFLNWYFHDKYGKDVLDIDGHFGAETEKYLMLFQREQNLTADGLCGEKTIAKMKEVRA